MTTEDDDDGDGATGDEVEDDGDGATGDGTMGYDDDDDDNGATGDEARAPVLVPMTSVFFGLFSHTLTIKATLDNTLVDIMPSLVLL